MNNKSSRFNRARTSVWDNYAINNAAISSSRLTDSSKDSRDSSSSRSNNSNTSKLNRWLILVS